MPSAGSIARIIAERKKPLEPQGGLVALFGNLAPQGAILKRSAADSQAVRARGPGGGVLLARRSRRAHRRSQARRRRPTTSWCCKTPDRIRRRRCRRPAICRSRKSSPPKGVKDMVRVSDARMSGTAFGTIVLHVTPDCASGGPLGLVRNGDRIRLSVKERRIDLVVDEAELKRARRRAPSRRRSAAARLCQALCAGNSRRRSGLRFCLFEAALSATARRRANFHDRVHDFVGLMAINDFGAPKLTRDKSITHKLWQSASCWHARPRHPDANACSNA